METFVRNCFAEQNFLCCGQLCDKLRKHVWSGLWNTSIYLQFTKEVKYLNEKRKDRLILDIEEDLREDDRFCKINNFDIDTIIEDMKLQRYVAVELSSGDCFCHAFFIVSCESVYFVFDTYGEFQPPREFSYDLFKKILLYHENSDWESMFGTETAECIPFGNDFEPFEINISYPCN